MSETTVKNHHGPQSKNNSHVNEQADDKEAQSDELVVKNKKICNESEREEKPPSPMAEER